jgi:transposase-like protein
MPAPHPKEFRDDVVAVARTGEAPIAQVAHDFDISESCLRNWLRQADAQDGIRPAASSSQSEEVRELKRLLLMQWTCAPFLCSWCTLRGPGGGP